MQSHVEHVFEIGRQIEIDRLGQADLRLFGHKDSIRNQEVVIQIKVRKIVRCKFIARLNHDPRWKKLILA